MGAGGGATSGTESDDKGKEGNGRERVRAVVRAQREVEREVECGKELHQEGGDVGRELLVCKLELKVAERGEVEEEAGRGATEGRAE